MGAPLAGGRRGAARPRGRGARSARAIEATQALRKWRDGVGAAPGARVPARLEADGYERVAEHVGAAGALRVLRQRRRAGRDRRRARRQRRRCCASDAVDLEAERSRAAERAERAASRDQARRGQARQPGLRRQGARRPSSRPSATSWTSSRRSWTSFHERVGPRPRRGAPALARAVRHALRPGAHAPAADGAGLAAGALPRRPRRRHQRQVLDGALHRGAAGGARRAHRRLPLAAPDVVRRAHPGRRRDDLPARDFARRDPARRGGRGEGRPDAHRRRARHPVRAADRRRVLRARPPRGRGRGRRGRPRRPLGRDQRARRARSSCSPTSGSSTRAGSARRSPTSRARSSRSCAPGATLVLGDDRARGGRARRARRARRSSARRAPASPQRSPTPCPATSGATSRPRAPPPRRCSAAPLDPALVAAVAALRASPAACRSSTTTR